MSRTGKYITIALIILALAGIGGCSTWYFTSTGSGIRTVKNFKSETNNGLKRRITVYNVDGDIIFQQTDKFDISYKDHDLQYVDSHNRKHNIYIGSGTVVVDDLE